LFKNECLLFKFKKCLKNNSCLIFKIIYVSPALSDIAVNLCGHNLEKNVKERQSRVFRKSRTCTCAWANIKAIVARQHLKKCLVV